MAIIDPGINAVIAPSRGQKLSGDAAAATVPLIQPETLFEPRRQQVDIRLTKIFRVGKSKLEANCGAYNALNATQHDVRTAVVAADLDSRRPLDRVFRAVELLSARATR